MVICKVDDCIKKHYAKSYCELHYGRFQKHGDPLITLKPINKTCSIIGCNKIHVALDLCDNHYRLQRRNGKPIKQEKIIKICKIPLCNRKHCAKGYCHKHYQKHSNPRSSFKQDLFLEIAMNNVRKRDGNTCKWYGCGRTSKEMITHIHHIFPRSEYPNLIYLEEYMICYCRDHHMEWHKARRDNCYTFI